MNTFEETVFGEVSSQDGSVPFRNQNNTDVYGPPETPTTNSIVLELEAVETKMVAAGSFECTRLNESSYENGTYAGSRYLYRAQKGTESLLYFKKITWKKANECSLEN